MIGNNIKKLRMQRGMTQKNLADQLFVSPQAVSRWEVGSALPDASNILQLSKLFGVSADYLLNDDCKEESPAHFKSKAIISIAGTFAKKIISLCVAGFGFIGNFVIYVLSRFIEVYVPYRYFNSETQSYWNRWDHGYSYRYFIEEYRLEPLTIMFWLMLIVGLFIAFVPRDKFMDFLGKAKDFIRQRLQKKKSQ